MKDTLTQKDVEDSKENHVLVINAENVKPLDLINALRATDDYIGEIFMQGGCYQFHLFLKAIFPEAIPYINRKKSHIYTKIGNDFHDILGVMDEEDEEHLKLLTGRDLERAKGWSFAKHNSLVLGDCTYCNEPIII